MVMKIQNLSIMSKKILNRVFSKNEKITLIVFIFFTYSSLFGQLSEKQIKPIGTVYFFHSIECPICIKNSIEIDTVLGWIKDNGIDFFFVYPGKLYSTFEIIRFHKKYKTGVARNEIVIDGNFQLTKKYNVKVTPQIIFCDSSDSIIYSGKLDDKFQRIGLEKNNNYQNNYLINAINDYRSGKPTSISMTEPLGCLITFK